MGITLTVGTLASYCSQSTQVSTYLPRYLQYLVPLLIPAETRDCPPLPVITYSTRLCLKVDANIFNSTNTSPFNNNRLTNTSPSSSRTILAL